MFNITIKKLKEPVRGSRHTQLHINRLRGLNDDNILKYTSNMSWSFMLEPCTHEICSYYINSTSLSVLYTHDILLTLSFSAESPR